MAMIRSAPRRWAARIASSPTAPSPTTATVLPGPTSAATAANQPVPSTSERGEQAAGLRLGGLALDLHERAVGSGMRAYSDWVPIEPIMTWWMQRDWKAGPADLARVVGCHERPDHEVAHGDVAHL